MENDAQIQAKQAHQQLTVDINQKDDICFVTLTPPDSLQRSPCDVCCVVDISGSMGSEATLKNENGDTESHGLSQLDLVKHSLKTIINILEPMDRLSIVSYSTNARLEYPLSNITPEHKAKMLQKVEDLNPENTTNLWEGLQTGLDVLVQNSSPSHVQVCLLLTDGQPNVNPPQGHVKALQDYIDKQGFLHPIINTYGYGYSLNSKLLSDIAIQGKGQYSFIPDSSFVGTVFVHALSNILATMAFNCVLQIQSDNEVNIIGGQGTKASWGVQIDIGNINFGQKKVYCCKLSGETAKSNFKVRVTYLSPQDGGQEIAVEQGQVQAAGQEFLVEQLRLESVDLINTIITTYKGNQNSVRTRLADFITSYKVLNNQDQKYLDIIKDLEGQVVEATSKDEWFTKWGRHYLRSLSRTHQLQQCNNFKDPGIQYYGGQLFNNIRDKSDDIFVNLPPPKPSIQKQNIKQVQSMRTYYNACSGCVHADNYAQLSNGQKIKLNSLKKGDMVLSSDNTYTSVVCMVQSQCPVNSLFQIENLIITPYHPILYKGSWQFPVFIQEKQEFVPAKDQKFQTVYSFVLENKKSMVIEGIQCISLGHVLKGEVVEHDYFGSEKIIKDLQRFSTWKNGQITLEEHKKQIWVRDNVTNNICGMIH